MAHQMLPIPWFEHTWLTKRYSYMSLSTHGSPNVTHTMVLWITTTSRAFQHSSTRGLSTRGLEELEDLSTRAIEHSSSRALNLSFFYSAFEWRSSRSTDRELLNGIRFAHRLFFSGRLKESSRSVKRRKKLRLSESLGFAPNKRSWSIPVTLQYNVLLIFS